MMLPRYANSRSLRFFIAVNVLRREHNHVPRIGIPSCIRSDQVFEVNSKATNVAPERFRDSDIKATLRRRAQPKLGLLRLWLSGARRTVQ